MICLMSICFYPKAQVCDPSNPYDQIVSSYHSSLARSSAGIFYIWGEQTGPTSSNNDLLSPTAMVSGSNGFIFSGTPLLAAMGSHHEEPQVFLLTTNGLYVWGTEGLVIHADNTTSDAIQLVTGTGTGNGLPAGVSPSDVKYLTATYKALAIVTNSGNVYVLGAGSNCYGDGTTTANTVWHQVKTNSTTAMTDISHMRISYKGGFAVSASNTWYTWGQETMLGTVGSTLDRTYATVMTKPADFTAATQVKMIQTASQDGSTSLMSYYVLHGTTQKIYVLGANGDGELGIGSTTDQPTWANVVVPGSGTTHLTGVKFMSANESDDNYKAAGCILTNGTVYTWGDDSYNMTGLDSKASRPTVPNGFLAGTDKALYLEVGGHTTVLYKEGASKFCYVGHKIDGSMGDGSSSSDQVDDFDCSGTPTISICAATNFDGGDVPSSYENGFNATHDLGAIVSLWLGATKPSLNNFNLKNVAAGANNNGNNGDGSEEDGIVVLPNYTATGSYSVNIAATNNTGAAANLYVWADWNHNGLFEPTEIATIGSNASVATGTSTKTASWSGLPTSGLVPNLFLRVRLASQALADNAATATIDERSIGYASNGEIEDYRLDATYAITGTVLNDVDGLADNLVNGSGTNAGGLNAVLYNKTKGTVEAIATVDATTGGYAFNAAVPGNDYSIYVTTSTPPIGQTATPALALPNGWVYTGEHLGSGTGSDGSINGVLEIGLVNGNTDQANFGLDRRPTTTQVSSLPQQNPGGNAQVMVPTLKGTDPEQTNLDGATGNITVIITSVPSNGTLFYNGIAITAADVAGNGLVVSNYDTALLTADPFDNISLLTFNYKVVDAAGIASAAAAGANIPFTSPLAFTCNNTTFHTKGSNANVELFTYNLLTATTSAPLVSFNDLANALAYNPTDNLLWLMITPVATGGAITGPARLARVDANGAVAMMAVPNLDAIFNTNGLNPTSGGITPNGYYVVKRSSSAASADYAIIDINPARTTYLQVVDPSNSYSIATTPFYKTASAAMDITDWAYNTSDGLFHGVTATGKLATLNIATGAYTIGNTITLPDGTSAGSNTYGSVFIDATGSLYTIANNGRSLKVSLPSGNAVLLSAAGTAVTNTDGANCHTSSTLR